MCVYQVEVIIDGRADVVRSSHLHAYFMRIHTHILGYFPKSFFEFLRVSKVQYSWLRFCHCSTLFRFRRSDYKVLVVWLTCESGL